MIIKKVFELFKKHNIELSDVDKAMTFLVKYGYLNADTMHNIDNVIDAIKKMQKIYGILTSGELNQQTLHAMSNKRCGCLDIALTENVKWNKNKLTYVVKNPPIIDGQRSMDTFKAALKEAFADVPKVCNMEIVESNSNQADFLIDTRTGKSNGFDGSGGVLAWATLGATNRSELVFDGGESWTFKSNMNGIRIINVIRHEVGHILDLNHSQVQSALMAPYYNPNITTFKSPDDIERLQAKYGKPVIPQPKPEPTPIPTPSDKIDVTISVDNIDRIKIPGYRLYKLA